MSPPSNSFVDFENLQNSELLFPLKINICEDCLLVQAEEYKKNNEIFDDNYLYFSSYSESWLKHSENYVEMITQKLSLSKDSFVIEIASNDGYLLQYFKQKNIPCLGVEPTKNTAKIAQDKGIETITDFFGVEIAKKLSTENRKADLILGNNVLAHTPYINDFVEGIKIALKPEGICTFEFPHILNLINKNQFDTIYHEHFSYFSLYTVTEIFKDHGLEIFDVEELNTHGGSLRVFGKHSSNETNKTETFQKVWNDEKNMNLHKLSGYLNFEEKALKVKKDFIEFLEEKSKQGRKIAAYGAAAKGNTLLNFSEVNNEIIKFVVDKSPYKQGKYLPGSKIPVVDEKMLEIEKPDYIIIFPWNLEEEITKQLSYVRTWNAKFVVAIPKLKII
jgi:SAM-dependent methyltransferase